MSHPAPILRLRSCAASLVLVAAALLGAACNARLAATLPPPGPVPPGPGKVANVPAPPRAPEAAGTTAFKVPDALLQPGASLSLADVVSVALENNPVTRASWLAARSAAANLGSRRAPYYPTLDLAVPVTWSQQASSDGRQNDATTFGGPALTLNYLLLDFGGRRASAQAAYWNLVAADWLHNATIQNTVFDVLQAYYQYLNAKGQVAAAKATLDSARANLQAAEVRHEAGVATIADVLQARTAVSQAELALQTFEGIVTVFRGALATSMGLPASIPLDVGDLPSELPTDKAQETVETLIANAMMQRPDLSAARAQVERAAQGTEVVRSEGLPSVFTSASVGESFYQPGTYGDFRTNWTARVLFAMPLFTGFANSYELQRAQRDTELAAVQVQNLEQQVILQVWTSYYALQTATRRVATSHDLLESATQSERVAFGRYKEGVGTIIDLLVAQSALANARAIETQARAEWFISLARLARDTGSAAPLADRIQIQNKP